MASARPAGGDRDRGVVPRVSPYLQRWFAAYLRRYIAKSFTGMRLARDGMPPEAPGRPLLVYSNHPSWWDPVIIMSTHWQLMGEREGYGPMDAAALDRYRFFRRLGLFGVERDTLRGARTFLRTGRAILERPGAVLWLTAEGTFHDPRSRPVELRGGLARLAFRAPDALMVPLALEYPFWEERLPEALLYFGEPIEARELAGAGAAEVTLRAEQRLEETMDSLAAQACERDPERFVTLIEGRVGVGAVYDGWRRLRARLTGKSFEAAHRSSGP